MPAGLRNEKEREAAAEKGKNDFRVNIQSMNSDSHAPNDLSINDFLSFFIFSKKIIKWIMFLLNKLNLTKRTIQIT